MSGIGTKQTQKIKNTYTSIKSDQAINHLNQFRQHNFSHMHNLLNLPTSTSHFTQKHLADLDIILTMFTSETIEKLKDVKT